MKKFTTSSSFKLDLVKDGEKIRENNMDTWKPNCDILKEAKKVDLDEISGNKFWCKSVDLQKILWGERKRRRNA